MSGNSNLTGISDTSFLLDTLVKVACVLELIQPGFDHFIPTRGNRQVGLIVLYRLFDITLNSMSAPISDNNLFRIGILKSNRTHSGDGILFITNQDPVLNLR